MPLVNPIPLDDPEISEMVKFYNETLGFCPNSLRTMQIRPEIAKAFVNMNKAVMANHGRVTSALKRLVAYICSHVAGCQYCQAHAIRAAERYGSEEDKMYNIWEYKSYSAFSDAERVALDFALAASSIPNAVDEGLSKRLREHWNDGEIVELLGVISLFGYLNRWNDSMGTQLEDPAKESGEKYLGKGTWDGGKHV